MVMLIVSMSHPLIHLWEYLSNHKVSLVPISMFTTDESMLHCLPKSLQIDTFEKKASAVN